MRVVHSFQTNATLITDEWCDLFERWQVSIGVSVDGPRELHDAQRVTRKGQGTPFPVFGSIDPNRGWVSAAVEWGQDLKKPVARM